MCSPSPPQTLVSGTEPLLPLNVAAAISSVVVVPLTWCTIYASRLVFIVAVRERRLQTGERFAARPAWWRSSSGLAVRRSQSPVGRDRLETTTGHHDQAVVLGWSQGKQDLDVDSGCTVQQKKSRVGEGLRVLLQLSQWRRIQTCRALRPQASCRSRAARRWSSRY